MSEKKYRSEYLYSVNGVLRRERQVTRDKIARRICETLVSLKKVTESDDLNKVYDDLLSILTFPPYPSPGLEKDIDSLLTSFVDAADRVAEDRFLSDD